MKEEDLDKVIGILEQNSSEEDAHFEFTFDNDDFFHIKSNKEGIILFSKEILKTIKGFKNTQDVSRNIVNLSYSSWLINNDIFAPYVEPVYERRENIITSEPEKTTWKAKFFSYLLVIILLVVVASFLIGFIEILNWIF